MLDKEFYSSKEDNVFREIKKFPPETYFKASEIRSTPPEVSAKGGEVGMTGKPSKKHKNEGRGDLDRTRDASNGATESAGGTAVGGAAAAGGVSVAAAALAITVVAMSGLIAAAPEVNVQRVEAGCDYVVYELYLENIDEDTDYFVSVANENEEYVQGLEEGYNENVVEDLQPNTAYVFSVKGEESDGTDAVIYYQTTVYTTVEEIVDSYVSSFNQNVTEEVEVFWDEGGFNRIVFPVNFKKQEDGEYLRIIAYDANGTEYARVDCDGKTAELNVPASAVGVVIEYQTLEKLDGEEKIYETLDGGTLNFSVGVAFSDALNVIGYNYGEISIDFSDLNGTLVSADAVYGYGDNVIGESVTPEDLQYGQYVIGIGNYGGEVFSVKAEIEVKGPYGDNLRRLVIEKDYTLESVFEVEEITYFLADYSINSKNTVLFDINFWGSDTAVLKLDDGTEYPLNDASFQYTGSETKTYQYSLFDGGQQLTDWVEFVLHPVVMDQDKYTYAYTGMNPNEVFITYNDDETVNFYVPEKFSCDDPDVLYDVILDGEIYYSGRDYFCAIENMPNDTYGLNLRVYKLLDGVKHSIFEYNPSGTIGESGYFGNVAVTNEDGLSTLTLTILDSSSYIYDYDSFVITADGITYTVSAADFVEDDTGYYKVCMLTVPQVAEGVTVTFYANSTAEHYEELAEKMQFKGEILTEQSIEITISE